MIGIDAISSNTVCNVLPQETTRLLTKIVRT